LDARALARRLRALVGESTGRHRRWRRQLDGSAAAILMYHRVLPRERARTLAVEPGMYVTPETFALHLDCLQARFRVLPLAEVAARLAAEQPLPPGACAISFDDGWRDNLEHALPALRSRDLPATVFLVTERVGTAGAFWPDEVCRRIAPLGQAARRELAARLGIAGPAPGPPDLLTAFKARGPAAREALMERLREATPAPPDPGPELLDWAEVHAMAREGIEFESHGASHAILTQLTDALLRRELGSARERLRDEGLGRHGLLAYPSGAFDRRVRDAAAASGHRAAVTTVRGIARRRDDLLALSRIGLHQDVSGSRAELLRLVPGPPPASASGAPA